MPLRVDRRTTVAWSYQFVLVVVFVFRFKTLRVVHGQAEAESYQFVLVVIFVFKFEALQVVRRQTTPWRYKFVLFFVFKFWALRVVQRQTAEHSYQFFVFVVLVPITRFVASWHFRFALFQLAALSLQFVHFVFISAANYISSGSSTNHQ